jgi:uncharacterized protein
MFVDLPGPSGRIEAILSTPERPRFAAVVAHPHPLFGGTMHNHATYRLARALEGRGGATLRFHFRGVGRSEGVHDEGVGEVDDVRAMLDQLAGRHPGLPLWSTGFSFGARMALHAALRDARVTRALGLGLAVRRDPHAFARSLVIPVAVVQGDRDEFGPPAEVEAVLRASAGPRRVFPVAGASHLFTEALDALEAQVRAAAEWLEDLSAEREPKP